MFTQNWKITRITMVLVGLIMILAACGGGALSGSADEAVNVVEEQSAGARDSNEAKSDGDDNAPANEPLENADYDYADEAEEAPSDGEYDYGADDSSGAVGAAAPEASVGGGVSSDSSTSSDSDEAVAVVPPDEQFQVSLRAGEINDNELFEEYLQYRLDFNRFLGGTVRVNDVDISERHAIHVIGSNGLPILGAEVLIYEGQGLVTELRTTATGIAYFFPNAYPANAGAASYVVNVSANNKSGEFNLTRDLDDAVWEVELGTRSSQQRVKLDILFLIDATGSMSAQIEQLKDNVLSISAQIEALSQEPDTRFGMVAYRDRGDSYVTKPYAFTDDVRDFQRDLDGVHAAGGGDTPEAMNEGLNDAIWNVDWRDGEVVKIIILVADAPPHLDYNQDYDYSYNMINAAGLGIKIFPVMADTGVTGHERDQAEYIFRQMAQFTGGHFVFITSEDKPRSDGGEGSDVSVQEDDYSVEHLDVLIVRLIQAELEALLGGS